MSDKHHPRLAFDPPTTPPAVRRTDPDTSWEGWAKVAETLSQRQRRVLAELEAEPAGLTGGEIAARLDTAHNWISGRITELCRDGLVVDSGERRVAPSGSRQTVWKATNARQDPPLG